MSPRAAFVLGRAARSAAAFLVLLGSVDAWSAVATYRITGSVTLSDAPADESGTTVRAVGPVTVTTTTAADGSFVLADLPPGTYDVDASRTGYTADSEAAVDLTTADANVDLALRRLVRLSGRVVLSALPEVGAPAVNGLTVTLSGGDAPLSTTTDVAGAYFFAAVPAGDYTVAVAGDCVTTTSASVSLVAADVTADLAAPSSARGVTGAVRLPGRETGDQSGVAIQVRTEGTADARLLQTLTSNPLGAFRTRLCPATYVFVASHPSYQSVRAVVNVAAVDVQVPTIFLAPIGPFTVSGKVTLGSGAPAAGVAVRIDELPASTVTTDGTGAYAIPGVDEGVYTLVATKTGFYPIRVPNLSISRATNIDLTMTQAPALRQESKGCDASSGALPALSSLLVVLAALLLRRRARP